METETREEKLFKLNEIVKGRTAICDMIKCKTERPSDAVMLPFFRYNETQETDSYYCGCIGWD
jgi:hypothetical protein